MSWIILALTLGASITSIIHGVFMLFGSLSVTGAALPGIPSTMLAALPVISAVFALTGGIIAFNQSKWGALFLFIATGLCVPARDTWLYGGIYFFAALLCFFLRSHKQEQDIYYNDDDGGNEGDFYYEQEEPPAPLENSPVRNIDLSTLDEDINISVNNERPQLRRRMSKICPECGAIVAREDHFCPNCGAKLFVAPDDDVPAPGLDIPTPTTLRQEHEEEDIERVNEQLLTPMNNFQVESASVDEDVSAQSVNYSEGDEDMTSAQTVPNYRVLVKPNSQRPQRNNAYSEEAASSYQEFSNSKYTRRGKKPKRSAGRKVLSMLLLVAAVGGALYFLLGLRKLPPGDLPPMVRQDVIPVVDQRETSSRTPENVGIAEPVDVVVAENILPNFTPDRSPTNGAITGNGVNVRADHTTASARVARLNGGTRVEVLGSFNVPSGQFSGIWYNIRTGGKTGWVYGRYLQPLGSGLPAGYSNGLLRTFGSTRSQLVDSLGQPTRSTGSTAEWPGLTATLKGEDITRIRLTSSSRELQNGLKPGMSQTALTQIMGYPSSVNGRTMNYNENGKTGLSVQLDRNNAISTITVSEVQ